jgi:hypothetical protein
MRPAGTPGVGIAAIAALALSTSAALAQEVKVGVVLPYTGIGAELAQQMDRGMELYLKRGRATPPHCISATDGSAEFARQRASHSLRRHNEAACIDAIINVAVFDTAVDATVWRERKRPLLLNKFKA